MRRMTTAATAAPDGVAPATPALQAAVKGVPVGLGAATRPRLEARGRDIGRRATGAGVARGRPHIPERPVIPRAITVRLVG